MTVFRTNHTGTAIEFPQLVFLIRSPTYLMLTTSQCS